MAIRSMTGYGRAESAHEGWRVLVELRSVNHRGLDLRLFMPSALAALEADLRERVKASCGRGRIECRVTLDWPTEGGLSRNVLDHARQIRDALDAVRAHLGIHTPIGMPELLQAGLSLAKAEPEPPPGLEEMAASAVDAAVAALVESRSREGSSLHHDLESRLQRVLSLVHQIEGMAREASLRYREMVAERIEQVLAPVRAGLTLDEDRLRQELVIAVDRSDITEEVVRARTHATSLLDLLQATPAGEPRPVGKRIDFFLQELGREANTMASKSVSASLTAHVVEVKDEVERMREQAQNIE